MEAAPERPVRVREHERSKSTYQSTTIGGRRLHHVVTRFLLAADRQTVVAADGDIFGDGDCSAAELSVEEERRQHHGCNFASYTAPATTAIPAQFSVGEQSAGSANSNAAT